MQFDVIIGNPPYQLDDGGFGRNASPIYQLFVDQCKKLNHKYVVIVIPSQWSGDGKGLSAFRASMLADDRIHKIVEYENANEAFSGIYFAGGVCYFLCTRDERGLCEFTNVAGNSSVTTERRLDEFSTIVWQSAAIPIIRKVMAANERRMNEQVSSRQPFGLAVVSHKIVDRAARRERGVRPSMPRCGWSLL